MLKICRVLNKKTGENLSLFKLDTELVNSETYPYIEIPNDNSIYKVSNSEIGYELDSQKIQEQNQEVINKDARLFLSETDWKVIRHRDQIALGIETSLTSEEFQQLLSDRQQARDKVTELT